MKRGLITGITRQDGSYRAELLLEKGYEVTACRVNSDKYKEVWNDKELFLFY